jgi:hypothetical protein
VTKKIQPLLTQAICALLLVCSLSYITSIIPKPSDGTLIVEASDLPSQADELRQIADTSRFQQVEKRDLDSSFVATLTGKNDNLLVIETANVNKSNNTKVLQSKEVAVNNNVLSQTLFASASQISEEVKKTPGMIPVKMGNDTSYFYTGPKITPKVTGESGYITPSQVLTDAYVKSNPFTILATVPMFAEGNGTAIAGTIFLSPNAMSHPDPGGKGPYGFNTGLQSTQDTPGHSLIIANNNHAIPSTLGEKIEVLKNGYWIIATSHYQDKTYKNLKASQLYNKKLSLEIFLNWLDIMIQLGFGDASPNQQASFDGGWGYVRRYEQSEKMTRGQTTKWLNDRQYCTVSGTNIQCAEHNISGWNDEKIKALVTRLMIIDPFFGDYYWSKHSDPLGSCVHDQIRRMNALDPLYTADGLQSLMNAKISAFPVKR